MITPYGAFAALALALMLSVTAVLLHRKGLPYGCFIRFAVLAIPFAFLGSRIAFCLSNLPYYLETISMPEMMLHTWDGGASMTGAMAGVLLAAAIAAKWARIPAGDLMDALAFGMPAGVFVERLAEPLCEMGWGKYFLSTLFDPLIDLTDGMHPVFAYEAIAALVICIAMLVYFHQRSIVRGDAMCFFLLLYGCTQTVLESLRNDGHMKVIHFVRVNQVAAIVMAVAVLILWSIRCVKNGGRKEAGASWLTAVVCVIFGVVQEFAADGDENPYFSLTLVSAIVAVLLVAVCVIWYAVWRRKSRSALVVPAVAVATALLVLIERTMDTGYHRLFFVYGIMAANLYLIAHMAFAMRAKADMAVRKAQVAEKYGLMPPKNR